MEVVKFPFHLAMNRHIPREIRKVGFDDIIDLAESESEKATPKKKRASGPRKKQAHDDDDDYLPDNEDEITIENEVTSGWTRGKAGWERSSDNSYGFRFGRYK